MLVFVHCYDYNIDQAKTICVKPNVPNFVRVHTIFETFSDPFKS